MTAAPRSTPSRRIRTRLRACVLPLLAALACPAPAYAWWNCAWTARAPLDVTGAASGAIVETVLGPAALPGFAWGSADAAVRVVDQDDVTLLTHFTEPRPDAVQRLHLWFRLPTGASGARRVYVYYGNAAATSTSSSALFTAAGTRLLTRQLTGTTQSTLAGFFGLFDAAASPAGYGCQVLPDYVNRSNLSVFGGGTNVHYSTLFFLDVPAAQAGTWSFRLGPDYGQGGALYAGTTTLQSKWGTDLWWAGSYANAAQLLQGSVTLAAGRTMIMAYGTEGCCEGLAAMQARPPGAANYLDLTTANFTLAAPSCPVAGLAAARVPDAAGLVVRQVATTTSDPISGTTNPKSIPGARKRYTVRVADGGGASVLDSNTLAVVVPLPPNTIFVAADLAGPGTGPVRFVNGTPSSGLTYTYTSLASTSDDLSFSNDGGATFGYTPVPDAQGRDANVTHLRVNPKGKPACTTTGAGGAFDLEFAVEIR